MQKMREIISLIFCFLKHMRKARCKGNLLADNKQINLLASKTKQAPEEMLHFEKSHLTVWIAFKWLNQQIKKKSGHFILETDFYIGIIRISK